jgi:hypothetical protein
VIDQGELNQGELIYRCIEQISFRGIEIVRILVFRPSSEVKVPNDDPRPKDRGGQRRSERKRGLSA